MDRFVSDSNNIDNPEPLEWPWIPPGEAASLKRVMYLPRTLISHLYQHLVRTYHSQSPPVLILVALEPDALCACRVLTSLLKRDYITHKIQPIAGYGDLTEAGQTMVVPMKVQNGGSGGVVICLGVGGLVDMSSVLGLDDEGDGSDPSGGVEVWLIDARRPWNLGNVFAGNPQTILAEISGNSQSRESGVERGQLQPSYRPGQGGIIVYDDGDIDEELVAEREAYCTLADMGDVEAFDDDDVSTASDHENGIIESIEGNPQTKKRRSWSDREEEDESDVENRPRQRRRRSRVSFPLRSNANLLRMRTERVNAFIPARAAGSRPGQINIHVSIAISKICVAGTTSATVYAGTPS